MSYHILQPSVCTILLGAYYISHRSVKRLWDSPWRILHLTYYKQVFVRFSLVHLASHNLQTSVCKLLLGASYISHLSNTRVWDSHLRIAKLISYKHVFVRFSLTHRTSHIVQTRVCDILICASCISHLTSKRSWEYTGRIFQLTSYKQARGRPTFSHRTSHIVQESVCEILLAASYISHLTNKCAWDSHCRVLHLTYKCVYDSHWRISHLTYYTHACVRFSLVHLTYHHIVQTRGCKILLGA